MIIKCFQILWLFRAEKNKFGKPEKHSKSPQKRQTHKRCTRKVFIVTFEKQHTILRLESFANFFFLFPFRNIQTFHSGFSFTHIFPACESNRISDGIEIETSRLFTCLPSSSRTFLCKKDGMEGRENVSSN